MDTHYHLLQWVSNRENRTNTKQLLQQIHAHTQKDSRSVICSWINRGENINSGGCIVSSASLFFARFHLDAIKKLSPADVIGMQMKTDIHPKPSSAPSSPKQRWKWRQMQCSLYEFLLHLPSVWVKLVWRGDKSTLNPPSNVELTSHAWLFHFSSLSFDLADNSPASWHCVILLCAGEYTDQRGYTFHSCFTHVLVRAGVTVEMCFSETGRWLLHNTFT